MVLYTPLRTRTAAISIHICPFPLKVFFLVWQKNKTGTLTGMSASVVMGLVWLLILAGLGDSQRPQARLPA